MPIMLMLILFFSKGNRMFVKEYLSLRQDVKIAVGMGSPLAHRKIVFQRANKPPALWSASLFTSSSADCAAFPDKGATWLGGGNVRAYNRFAIRTAPAGPESCVVSVINQVVFGGWFPQFLMDKVGLRNRLSLVDEG